MRYLPHTQDDIDLMLKSIGLSSLDELFKTIPEDYRKDSRMDLPEPVTEWQLNREMETMASTMKASLKGKTFVGAGSYCHHIPAIVPFLAGRSEFATAYTPYQPEVSQGTLQGIYEFQTMISTLLGMDIATASHYDCGTALAEALLIAVRKRKAPPKVAISKAVHPHHRQMAYTYLYPAGFEIIEIPYTSDGITDLDALPSMGEIAGIALQSPNFFGSIENLSKARSVADNLQAVLISSFTEALAYGLLKSPGAYGVEIVAGEGQSLGIPQSFGGPGLGILSSKKEYMRSLPGRLVGRTTDINEDPGFVLTLSTREQHIRREKASSNICSNNGLNALTAGIYMACAGKSGIRDIAQQNHNAGSYLKKLLIDAGFTSAFDSPFFNEFVVKVPKGFQVRREALKQKNGTIAGLSLEEFYPELAGHYLFCATEVYSKSDIETLVKEVS